MTEEDGYEAHKLPITPLSMKVIDKYNKIQLERTLLVIKELKLKEFILYEMQYDGSWQKRNITGPT